MILTILYLMSIPISLAVLLLEYFLDVRQSEQFTISRLIGIGIVTILPLVNITIALASAFMIINGTLSKLPKVAKFEKSITDLIRKTNNG